MVIVDRRRHLPAQAQVQSQVWTEVPIVLRVHAENSLPESLRPHSACILVIEFGRIVTEKTRQRAEIEDSAGVGMRKTVKLLPLHPGPEFHGMASMRPKSVVVSLE